MEARSLILSPDQYGQVSSYELLCAAEQGFVGLDHRFLHAIVDDPEKSIPDLLRFGLEERPGRRDDLSRDLVSIFRHLRTPRSIPYLLEYLRRTHVDANAEIIGAFQEIGAPAVEPLLDFYKEMESEEDADAGFLLGSLGVRDPRILDVLLARLKIDPVDAAHCLAAYGDAAAIPAIREAIAGVAEPWMASSLELSAEELEEGPFSRDEPEESLWDLYPEASDPRFDLLTAEETELFLDSADADNRYAAVVTLSDPEAPKRLWDRLLQMAREDPAVAVRGVCWEALVEGWTRSDIRQALRDCMANEKASLEERCGAIQPLASREGDDPDVRRWILDLYALPEARAKALEAMAVSFDPRFEDYFRRHLDDPNPNICVQAMLGIGLYEMESEAPRLVHYFKDEELRSNALQTYGMCAPCEPSRASLRKLFQKIGQVAGGLSLDEEMEIKHALNARAARYELDPVYGPAGESLIDEPIVATRKVGRNDPCPCGSGKKYKKCCGG